MALAAPAGELARQVDRAYVVLVGQLVENLEHDGLHVVLLVTEIVEQRAQRGVGDLELGGGELEPNTVSDGPMRSSASSSAHAATMSVPAGAGRSLVAGPKVHKPDRDW